MSVDAQAWLAGVWIDPEVHRLRPDFRLTVVVAEGLVIGPADPPELAEAEAQTRERSRAGELAEHPHLVAWREAYRAFGAKPQRTRPSVDGLLRRLEDGLPRIDGVTDLYNAVSIRHVLPVGGEDLDRYRGSVRLVRAQGDEPFDTVDRGEPAVETPSPGEVVWRDDVGVTCRRWNWRQGTRTRITAKTTRAMFVLEGLDALGADGLAAAEADLTTLLTNHHPGVVLHRRTLEAAPA